MEQGNKKVILIAIVLALVTSGLIFTYLKQVEQASKNIEYQDIYVAAKNINAKAAITVQDIKLVKLEKKLVNKNALLNKDEIIGKIAKDTIYEGEQILKTRFAEKTNSSLAYNIPEGKRAVTINVNEASAVGFFIKVGDFVDIITTWQQESLEQKDKQIISPRQSKTLLQNVEVLGIGQEKEGIENAMTEKKDSKNSTANKEVSKTVTLAVTQEDAEKIALAEEAGILRLTLRHVGDDSEVDTQGVTRDDLVPQANKIIVSK